MTNKQVSKAVVSGGWTFFKSAGTSAHQKNYGKFLFELATVTSQALKAFVSIFSNFMQCFTSPQRPLPTLHHSAKLQTINYNYYCQNTAFFH